ncbi:MAG: hypothetical protein KIT17_02445 [Rubrivivax sp.]|nr:hypothetical protein [Rubrivivax sp.]
MLPLLACLLASQAGANQGLLATADEWLWPRVQARITVQTAALDPLTLTSLGSPGTGLRGVQGGSVLGDYVIATPNFGNFRATSGVMLGSPAGAPVLSATPLARVGVSVYDNGSAGYGAPAADGPATLPYVGLGYSSASLWRSLSLSADVGWVAGRPAGLSGLGRAMYGNQSLEAAVRELRLAPVLHLGVRYSF